MKYQYNKSKLIFFLLYTILSINTSIGTYISDKIIAIIDEDIILESDIKKEKILNDQINKNNLYNTKNNTIISKKDILNQLITNTIILQLAKQASISINENQINTIINYINMKNNMTKKEFLSYLKNNNINYNNYIEYLKKNIIINTIYEYEMHQRIEILPYELNTMIQKISQKNNNTEFRINHILIPLQENATKNQIEQAKKLSIFLKKELQHGIHTKKLLMLYSKNKKSQTIKINKIDWSTIKELPTLFSENLIKEKLKINSIIGPIYSGIGFHILKIKDIYTHTNINPITKIHARHIFIKKTHNNNDDEIQKKLLQTKKRIENDSSTFFIEAKQISEDEQTSDKGGDLGWKYLEDFDDTLQISLQSIKKGKISSPIKTSQGWHLIQLINSKQVDKNEIFYKKHAYQKIFNKKTNTERNYWIQELKTSTYIKIFNNYDQTTT